MKLWIREIQEPSPSSPLEPLYPPPHSGNGYGKTDLALTHSSGMLHNTKAFLLYLTTNFAPNVILRDGKDLRGGETEKASVWCAVVISQHRDKGHF